MPGICAALRAEFPKDQIVFVPLATPYEGTFQMPGWRKLASELNWKETTLETFLQLTARGGRRFNGQPPGCSLTAPWLAGPASSLRSVDRAGMVDCWVPTSAGGHARRRGWTFCSGSPFLRILSIWYFTGMGYGPVSFPLWTGSLCFCSLDPGTLLRGSEAEGASSLAGGGTKGSIFACV